MNDEKLNKLIAQAFDLQAPPMPDFKAEAEKQEKTAEVKPLLRQVVELDYEQLDYLAAARKSPDLPKGKKP